MLVVRYRVIGSRLLKSDLVIPLDTGHLLIGKKFDGDRTNGLN
jgi:hypothetical protein